MMLTEAEIEALRKYADAMGMSDAAVLQAATRDAPNEPEYVDLPNCFEIARMEEAGLDWKADPEPGCTCLATVGVPHAESCPVTQWGREQFKKSGEFAQGDAAPKGDGND